MAFRAGDRVIERVTGREGTVDGRRGPHTVMVVWDRFATCGPLPWCPGLLTLTPRNGAPALPHAS